MDMKRHKEYHGKIDGPKLKRFGLVALLGFLLFPFFFFVVLKPSLDATSAMNVQLSLLTNIRVNIIEEHTSTNDKPNTETRIFPAAADKTIENMLTTNVAVDILPGLIAEKENKGDVDNHIEEDKVRAHDLIPGDPEHLGDRTEIRLPTENAGLHVVEDKQEAHDIMARQPNLGEDKGSSNLQSGVESRTAEEKDEQVEIVPGEVPIVCDFSQTRSDTCVMEGDIRVLPQFSTLLLVTDRRQHDNPSPAKSWKVRPYARKWEGAAVMQKIRELELKGPVTPQESPQCDINHQVPAIIFSTGGFLGNAFHDFTDVLIPLFITSRQYNGEVQFHVIDYNWHWINKYQPILRRLSRYEVINLEWQGQVHCYPKVHVGLISHKELGIDTDKSSNDYSMDDFRELLRESFSLPRKSVSIGTTKKPRLVIINRTGSRSFINKDEVVKMARRVGYKVVLAGPDKMRNLARFARLVNSCDVMMGVHGAGLANMIFLPANATLIQIVPWGGLGYASRHDFGIPAPDMGLSYLEYEIQEEESSLIYQYPREHPVFTDPLSIHKQGWNELWSVFLHQQHVRLDVRRFHSVLQEALRSLH